MIDPRKRALAALAGGAYLPTEEVDVSTVDVGPTAVGFDEQAKPPTSEEVARGKPVIGEVRAAPDEYAQALQESNERAFRESLGGIGSGIIEAFTGVGPKGDNEARQKFINEPIAVYLQKQMDADKARELELRAPRTVAGKPQLSPDPKSPESQRARLVARRSLEGLYTDEEIEQLSEADIYRERGAIQAGTAALGREVSREAEVGRGKRFTSQQEQQGEQFAEMMGYRWADMSQEERLSIMRRTDELKKQEKEAAGKQTEQATGLRKEFEGHQTVKDYRSTKVSLEKLRNAAQDPSAAGDLALIFSYMKILDPGSVVKETEFANAQNAAGVPERIRNTWNKALSGERLAPNQRKDFIRSAQRLFSAQESAYNELAAQYEGLAPEGMGGQVVLPPKKAPAPQRKPATQALPTDSSGQPTLDAPPSDRVRVIINGKPYRIPNASLQQAQDLAKKRGDAFEVTNG